MLAVHNLLILTELVSKNLKELNTKNLIFDQQSHSYEQRTKIAPGT